MAVLRMPETFGQPPASYTACAPETGRASWNPKVARFYEYWLSIRPAAGGLPGRQHFDPLGIPDVMPRVWMLDVLRDPLRYRYRMAGTKEVETLRREVTGRFFDEVHPTVLSPRETYGRFDETVRAGIATYRRGPVTILHEKEHRIVENCMVPLARDGRSVDIIAVCSVLYRTDGTET